jgi:hypothetical protein
VNSYQIPQIVYVGDRATLVVPLENPPAGESSFSGELPSLPDLIIHKIELESRGGKGLLLIDFTAYAPGILDLPPFEMGGIPFWGLRIEIASILGSGEGAVVFSPPAPPLAIPGTGLLISGTMTGIIVVFLVFFWALFWVPRRAGGWLKNRRRRGLILSLAGMERRLRRELIRGNTTALRRGERLNFLAGEFRTFLGLFTGENCRAMTAGELSRLSFSEASPLGGDFLGPFFSRCDNLRFSGGDVSAEELLDLLGDLKIFIDALKAPVTAGKTAVPPAGPSAALSPSLLGEGGLGPGGKP